MCKFTQKNIFFAVHIALLAAPFVPRYDRGYLGDDYSDRIVFLESQKEIGQEEDAQQPE